MTDPKPTAAEIEQRAILWSVGDCLQAWSEVEHSLTTLFRYLMNSDQPAKDTGIFSAVISFEARLAMITYLVDEFEKDDFQKSWAALSNKLTKSYRKRHEVAHFTIIASVKTGIPVLSPFYTVARPPEKKFSSKELRERAD